MCLQKDAAKRRASEACRSMNMKRLTTALITVTTFSAVFAQTNDHVIHGQPFATAEQKMNWIILPTAPILNDDINVLDIFPWLELETKKYDPEGVGIKFEILAIDNRPNNERNTLDTWFDYKYDDKMIPRIQRNKVIRTSVYKYVTYLTENNNLIFTSQVDRVIIKNKAEDIEHVPPGGRGEAPRP